uniref:protein translocase subunit SecD n=1 Tax=Elioraea rosea TaxID=2492390 RepID=UPI00118246DF|nr:protein translocase subunit SecD [Elioraea rosea]
MMYFARWKVLLTWSVIALAALLALPSFLPRATLAPITDIVPLRTFQLGLDLRGGSYLLLEVDMQTVVRERLENIVDSTRTRLRGAGINYTGLQAGERNVTLRLTDPSQAPEATRLLRELSTPITTTMGQSQPDIDVQATAAGQVTIALSEPLLREKATQAVEQSIEIVRRRVDESGVAEALIQRQGANRLLVQLPGVQDPERIKQLIGKTARMTFHLLDENANLAAPSPPPGVQFLRGEGPQGQEQRYAVRRRVEVDGANLTDARAGQNPQTGEWVVNFSFDSVGQRRFADITRANVGRPFAIVLDDRVITAPVIREPITAGRGQISGSFNVRTANDLAVLLRAGALPAPLTVVEERTVGPDLGADAIRAGLLSVAVGFVLVCAYMAASYGLFGWFANIAIVANLVLTLAILAMLQATLTLPGIAGLLLSIGMAVDANILINERVREEVRLGRTPLSAIQTGFTKATGTILDSNLTVIIKMALLYALGSGPVKGFAVTVAFGVITSMFTATVLVKMLTASWYRRRRPAALAV